MNERDLEPARTSLALRVKGILEFSAAAGLLLFVALSVMYDQFYGPLGVEPEDVGLTQAVIVQRALAGVALIAATGVALVLALLTYQSVLYLLNLVMVGLFQRALLRDPGRLELIKKKVARDEKFATRVAALEWWASLLPVATPFQLFGIVAAAPPPWRNVRNWIVGSVLVCVASLALTFTIGLGVVRDASARAERGGTVTPITFAGIRVLDVESRTCTVTWLGDSAQTPQMLSAPDLRCLGRTSDTVVFRTSSQTVRVPASLVVVSSR